MSHLEKQRLESYLYHYATANLGAQTLLRYPFNYQDVDGTRDPPQSLVENDSDMMLKAARLKSTNTPKPVHFSTANCKREFVFYTFLRAWQFGGYPYRKLA
ncbi:hypothetical protein LMH87_009763 [Akanthomyces muscarius]|uniref:Uncharacterized protein n=1 Tax=Akanthomyces muscarius TaxID=2231603 RepID=A0A9W8ULB7_AKAMU|nr:hypothetical protein LMH87_009763 [Akanthomyces muscarius]KAJ4153268.1 hypothetical protein LMH87_009763 [Akanthomyces muscarius]